MFVASHDMEWRRFKDGDVKALESIYRMHVGALINYGLRITPNTDLIKDCIQDLFIELWKGRQQLADTHEPRYYLFRALRNKLSRALSRQSFVSAGEMRLPADHLVTEYVELEIAEREQAEQTRLTLQQLMEKLPRRQQEAIYLRFYHNFPYEVIATTMDMNYQSVLNLVQRALKSLRRGYGEKAGK